MDKKMWAVITITRTETKTKRRVLGAIPLTNIPYEIEDEEIREHHEQIFLFGNKKEIDKQIRKIRKIESRDVSLKVVFLLPDGKKITK